jgi:cell division transport system permease protein
MMISPSHFFSAFAKDLRIGQRILLETAGGIRRSGWMSLIILVTMTSILTIFGSLTLLVLDSQHLVERWGSQAAISVYLKNSANLADTLPEFSKMKHVVKVQGIPKAESWQKYGLQQKNVPDIPNPLPDTIHLEVDHPNNVPKLLEVLNAHEKVEQSRYPYDFLKRIRQLAQGISIFGILFTSFLGLLTLFIISNTISLLIQARRREIEILRMMGVSNWYIQLPFLMQGALYGMVGATLAYAPVASFQFLVRRILVFLHWDATTHNLLFVVGLMLIIGTLVGAFGASTSMKKYLNV